MKEKVNELVEALKKDPEFNFVDVYESNYEEWEYFFRLRGFHGNKFFHLEISRLKNYPDSHRLQLSSLTDCPKEINKKLNEFKIK